MNEFDQSPFDAIYQVINAAIKIQSIPPYNLDYPLFQVIPPSFPHVKRSFTEHKLDEF
jgi:hypothetical protein